MALRAELTPLLKRNLRRFQVPGAAVAILRNNRMYATAAAGVANLETRVPVTDDTVFQIGSITKPHTATLVMQLADEGRLDLDVPVREYLPDFRVADLAVSGQVTPRHFLSHQSGIDGDLFVDSGRGDESVQRLVDKATMVPSLFPVGEKLSYCNLGFAVLGRIIEVVTRQSWDEALTERLFEPLGMTHAFSQPEMALRYSCAIGHVPSQRRKNTWHVSRIPYLSFGQKAAGSTPSMSASDLAQFARMHMNGGRNQTGVRVVSAASVRAMQRRQIRAPRHTPHGISHWGLGWMLIDWNGHRLYGHDGATIGQQAFLRILPEQNLAVAMLTNGGDMTGLFHEMYGEIFRRLAGLAPAAVPEYDHGLKVDLDAFTGTYANLNQSIVVEQHWGELRVTVCVNGDMRPLIPDRSRLGFVDRHTARLSSGDPVLDRNLFLFSDFDGGRAEYVALGLRQYRRIDG
jgi:CubicO group peptidase (beta-lactamase class C family)